MNYVLNLRTRTRPNTTLLSMVLTLEAAVRVVEGLEALPELTFELVERR